jgi:membrane-bound lytic murein transglycosylase C
MAMPVLQSHPPRVLVRLRNDRQMLGAAERAVGSTSGSTVLGIVGGKDPAEIARPRMENYGRDPQALLRDLRSIQRDFQALMAVLTGEVSKRWGTK